MNKAFAEIENHDIEVGIVYKDGKRYAKDENGKVICTDITEENTPAFMLRLLAMREAKKTEPKKLKLTKLGEFVTRHSVMVPHDLWKGILAHAHKLYRHEDDGEGWQMFFRELSNGAEEMLKDEKFLEFIADHEESEKLRRAEEIAKRKALGEQKTVVVDPDAMSCGHSRKEFYYFHPALTGGKQHRCSLCDKSPAVQCNICNEIDPNNAHKAGTTDCPHCHKRTCPDHMTKCNVCAVPLCKNCEMDHICGENEEG